MTATSADSPATPPKPRWRDARSGAILAAVILVTAAFLVGRSHDDSNGGGTTVSGVVVDVQGSITELTQFDLVLDDGMRLTFIPEAGVLERAGFSPAHVREHSALVEPISVTYREVDGQNIVVGVGDAE